MVRELWLRVAKCGPHAYAYTSTLHTSTRLHARTSAPPHASLPVQAARACKASLLTSASLRPVRAGTWKE